VGQLSVFCGCDVACVSCFFLNPNLTLNHNRFAVTVVWREPIMIKSRNRIRINNASDASMGWRSGLRFVSVVF
jgi:hypothetical protein